MADKFTQLIEARKQRKEQARNIITQLNETSACKFKLADIRFIMAIDGKNDISEDEIKHLYFIYEKSR